METLNKRNHKIDELENQLIEIKSIKGWVEMILQNNWTGNEE